MICKRCYRLSDDDAVFCPYCGLSFTDGSEKPEDETDKDSSDASENDTSRAYTEEKEPINIPFTFFEPDQPYYYSESQPKPEQSPIAKLFSSMLHAVCYFILFLMIQSLVATGFQAAAMFIASTNYITDYFTANNIDVDSLSTEEYTAIIEKLTLEVEPLMIEAAYNVDFNLISVISSAITVIALIVLAKYRRRPFWDHTSLYASPLKNPRIWLCVPAAIAMQSIVIFIINIIPFPQSVLDSYNELYAFIGESPLWLELLSVVVGAPVVEELIFRGCIHTRLRRAMKPLTAALISAFIFGVAHGHLISATYAFILGLVLTYLYEKYESVLVPIIFHAAFNASNYIPLMTSESTTAEILITVAVSVAIFVICAVIVSVGPPKKTKEQRSEEEKDKGI